MNFKRITTFCVTIAIILSFSVATVFAVDSSSPSSKPNTSTVSSGKSQSQLDAEKAERDRLASSAAAAKAEQDRLAASAAAKAEQDRLAASAQAEQERLAAAAAQAAANAKTSSAVVSSQVSSAVSSAVSSQAVSSAISMPDVDSADISVPQLLGSGVYVNPLNDKNVLLGVIAWVCIGLGIIIVLVVLFSSKKNAHRSMGRKRYHRKSLKTHKKRLLDDKYYNRRKYK